MTPDEERNQWLKALWVCLFAIMLCQIVQTCAAVFGAK